jgi:hypothetical protein
MSAAAAAASPVLVGERYTLGTAHYGGKMARGLPQQLVCRRRGGGGSKWVVMAFDQDVCLWSLQVLAQAKPALATDSLKCGSMAQVLHTHSHVCVCVCVCLVAQVHSSVCVCVCVCARACMCVRGRRRVYLCLQVKLGGVRTRLGTHGPDPHDARAHAHARAGYVAGAARNRKIADRSTGTS